MAKDEREAESEEILRRVARDSGGLLSSALARAGDHMAARDAEPGDAVELWGRRIGRALSLIGVLVLLALIGQQLHLW